MIGWEPRCTCSALRPLPGGFTAAQRARAAVTTSSRTPLQPSGERSEPTNQRAVSVQQNQQGWRRRRSSPSGCNFSQLAWCSVSDLFVFVYGANCRSDGVQRWSCFFLSPVIFSTQMKSLICASLWLFYSESVFESNSSSVKIWWDLVLQWYRWYIRFYKTPPLPTPPLRDTAHTGCPLYLSSVPLTPPASVFVCACVHQTHLGRWTKGEVAGSSCSAPITCHTSVSTPMMIYFPHEQSFSADLFFYVTDNFRYFLLAPVITGPTRSLICMQQ